MESSFRRSTTLALSLILCLLLLACWMRSYWVIDTVSWGTATADHQLSSGGGRLIYADAQWPNGRAPFPAQRSRIPRDTPAWFENPTHSDGFRFLGFEYSTEASPYIMDQNLWFFVPPWKMVAVPYWAPFTLASLHPLARRLAASRRASRRRRGLCVDCGYDLRASGARCPECGAIAASIAAG
jgi:hypothetical protein